MFRPILHEIRCFRAQVTGLPSLTTDGGKGQAHRGEQAVAIPWHRGEDEGRRKLVAQELTLAHVLVQQSLIKHGALQGMIQSSGLTSPGASDRLARSDGAPPF